MRILATGSGGFSGLSEHYEADTSALPNGEMLEELLRNLDFLPNADQIGTDMMRWEITIDDGKQPRVVHAADDGSAESAPLHALLAELRASV